MLDAPQPDGRPSPSLTLTGDSIKGWEAILSLFYSEDYFALPVFTSDQWAGILRVSHKYMMDSLEEKARESLLKCQPPLDMVEMVLLAQEIDCNKLYEVACNTLAKSEITFDAAKRIGVSTFYNIISLKLAIPPKCRECPVGTASSMQHLQSRQGHQVLNLHQ
ncbi:hypothetical protein PIIN_02543 [Serendipita indica DSM 11827]|uniref:BTB domain-containing protein n=1 Tax=Serendipita indica (strain DSM 11827) TaxID=1109443 RepID=G4TBI5_SERID|nr:hypothetical protein PIIN_02543 [Serendipita indica DSM 11827]